jgi:nucleoid DNA-binding protein
MSNKADLVESLQRALKVPRSVARELVSSFVSQVARSVDARRPSPSITIVGLGTIEVRVAQGRSYSVEYLNGGAQGEITNAPSRKKIYFTADEDLNRSLN